MYIPCTVAYILGISQCGRTWFPLVSVLPLLLESRGGKNEEINHVELLSTPSNLIYYLYLLLRDLFFLSWLRSCIYVSHQCGPLDHVQDRSVCLVLFCFVLFLCSVLQMTYENTISKSPDEETYQFCRMFVGFFQWFFGVVGFGYSIVASYMEVLATFLLDKGTFQYIESSCYLYLHRSGSCHNWCE